MDTDPSETEVERTLHLGLLLNHLVAIVAGVICIVNGIEMRGSFESSFRLPTIAIGAYLISKSFMPVTIRK